MADFSRILNHEAGGEIKLKAGVEPKREADSHDLETENAALKEENKALRKIIEDIQEMDKINMENVGNSKVGMASEGRRRVKANSWEVLHSWTHLTHDFTNRR